MKKIYIIITFIMCLFLFGCSNDKTVSIHNEKEILDFLYSGYLDVDRPEYDDKYDDVLYETIRNNLLDRLDLLTINRNPECKIYEAMIYKKRYFAGYISNETIKKIIDYDGVYEYFMDNEKGYSSLYPIYSKLYQDGYLSLENDKTYLYSFNDGFPLEYDNKKLVFVIDYYEVSLNDDKIITPVMYVKGRTIDNYFYADVPIIFMNYQLSIYQEINNEKVMSLQDFYSRSTRVYMGLDYKEEKLITQVRTILEEEFNLLSEEEQRLVLECFEMLKPSFTLNNLNNLYEGDKTYYYDYLKLKEIIITG